jgi:hypothetical protein
MVSEMRPLSISYRRMMCIAYVTYDWRIKRMVYSLQFVLQPFTERHFPPMYAELFKVCRRYAKVCRRYSAFRR